MTRDIDRDGGCEEYVELERRALLGAVWRAGALAAVSTPAWLPRLAFAADGGTARDLIVCVFLRGGADGLTTCVPHGDAAYYDARPRLAVPRPDAAGEAKAMDLDGFFGLPPGLSALKPIYDAGQLAIVHAAGSSDPTRSHFEAQDIMEAGSAGIASGTGWLARHLLSIEAPQDARLRGVAASSTIPRSLAGAPATVAVPDIESYGLMGRPQTADDRQALIASMYGPAAEPARTSAANVVATIRLIDQVGQGGYTPANGAVYPEDEWGIGLRTIAQLARADVGLEVACLDLGGWDMHANEGPIDGQLNALMARFAAGLAAFHADMLDRLGSLTLVALSEFGRRVAENGSGGCDHGHGNALFVMGGNVNGGRVFADWPGLQPDTLYENRDLAVTTDYRDILAEILAHRAGNTQLDTVFPGYNPTFRGVTN
ncbi:MAG: DUF1501 domain-containing protein [Phycisphaerae bacterium]